MAANWQFFLGNTPDLSREAEITTYCRDKTLQIGLNRGGAFSFSVPMNSKTLEHTDTNANCVICRKNNATVWTGPLVTKEMDFQTEKISLSATGWFEVLMDRYIEQSIPGPYTNTSMGTIAFALLALANADTPTYITAGSNTNTSLVDKTYEGWESIGEEIIALSELEAGFDFSVHPVTRQLNIKNWNQYTTNTSVSFGYNWGSDNLATFNYSEDGNAMKNKIWGVGETTAADAKDSASISRNKIQRTEVITLNLTDDEDLLDAILAGEIHVKTDPPKFIGFDCKPYTEDPSTGGNPYSIFEDFNFGDKIKVVAKIVVEDEDGTQTDVTIRHDVRLFGGTVEIDNENNESLKSVETSYQGS